MFYYLHRLAEDGWMFLSVFKSVSFRAAFAAVMAFLICIIFGPRFINFLRNRRVEEDVSKKDSEFLVEKHASKKHTPTMGGVIILTATLSTVLFWCRLDVLFVPLCFFTMLALGLVGFFDDYIKLTHKKEDGLTKKEKLFFQFIVGGGVGLCLTWYGEQSVATKLVIPFTDATWWIGLGSLYILWAAFVMTGSSNAVNLTDGLDGLATLCIITVAVAFGLIAYFAGHAGIADHLGIVRVRGAEELAVVCAALAGACLGFLWFNAHPAEIFMGDTGSLPLGGLVGLVALCIKQELLLVIIGGVFVAEALSVMIQVFSFKYFGKRVFKIAPLHHHFEKVGWSETKIVTRFFIVSVLLAVFSVAALRIR
ncbi:MAG TPA: phospho-N-acetylmuramoyl-pentapeptide-transferase [Planctomycetota bacterium]|nr:phospho-N-acetylmuramoyl-pentapeptide-transferase [Planctomycetota bacterium]